MSYEFNPLAKLGFDKVGLPVNSVLTPFNLFIPLIFDDMKFINVDQDYLDSHLVDGVLSIAESCFLFFSYSPSFYGDPINFEITNNEALVLVYAPGFSNLYFLGDRLPGISGVSFLSSFFPIGDISFNDINPPEN